MKNKIIIVGGTGFLGFHLAKYYLKNNWQVLSISRKNPKKIRYLKSVNYLFVDIGDKKKLFTILKKHSNTDCIVNFSGEVDHSNSKKVFKSHYLGCLLYTSDAADDSLRVDLGGRRIIKKSTLLPAGPG